MSQEIQTIRLPMPFRMGSVNCYLMKSEAGFLLVDTGGSNQRAELVKELESAGCQPGNLKLIVITHGDFDHTGNAAYLRQKFGTKIAMHNDDSGMAEHGDMFWNRKKGNFLVRMIAPILVRFGKADRFEPDLYVEAGTELSEHGFDAKVLSIPGHSKGSIGILTAAGDLICGDLLSNTGKPGLSSLIDDPLAANTSVEKLKSLNIRTVYPGHGEPFPMELLIKNSQ